MLPRWNVEQVSRNVTKVVSKFDSVEDWEEWFLLRSDAHHDNPDSDWQLEKKHLDEAKERGAGIIDVGDIFCAMQGKWDKRSDKQKVRPEHQTGEYLDALVRTHADFYEDYARNWVVFADGNHETSILNRHETDLVERLCGALSDRTGLPVAHGGYSGWVWFQFHRGQQRDSVRLWYIHGYAGGGQVTKDRIQAQRQQVYVENADIMVSGHTHDSWVDDSTVKIRLSAAGKVERSPVTYIKTATYKDEYKQGIGGWHIGTGKPPKPLGAYWLRFYWDGKRRRVDYEIRRAK